jgi:hypothetical protein
MKLITLIQAYISSWKENGYINRKKRIFEEIEKETDPQKKIEKQTLLKIRGTLLGGMASSTAYMSFKDDYFNTLETMSEREEMKAVLLSMLKSKEYQLHDKIKIAFICADIVLPEAIPYIESLCVYKMSEQDKKEISDSLEALNKRESIRLLIYDRLREMGYK